MKKDKLIIHRVLRGIAIASSESASALFLYEPRVPAQLLKAGVKNSTGKNK